MQSLRAATWAAHQRLERAVDVRARFASLDVYKEHLERLGGFHAALESRIRPETFGAALPDYEFRGKLGLLSRDLAALGAPTGRLQELPQCPNLPSCQDRAEAFGCLYVAEGSTLGGRMLLPLAERCLGLDANRGASYLASYGERTDFMWAVFGAALDQWCAPGSHRERAAAAAIATFDALQDWLGREPRGPVGATSA